MCIMVSSSHIVSTTAQGDESFPCSSTGSLSWETVLYELLRRELITQATVLQTLLQCGFLFHGVQAFKNSLLQRWSSQRSQILPRNQLQCRLLSPWVCKSLREACSSKGFPTGSQPFLGHPPALAWGSTMGCRCISASLWISMDCRGTAASS